MSRIQRVRRMYHRGDISIHLTITGRRDDGVWTVVDAEPTAISFPWGEGEAMRETVLIDSMRKSVQAELFEWATKLGLGDDFEAMRERKLG